jgi:hypothetical protein
VATVSERNTHTDKAPRRETQGTAVTRARNGSGLVSFAHTPQNPAAPPGRHAVIPFPHSQAGPPPAPAGRGQVIVPRLGLRFARRLPFEAWADIGRQLSTLMTSSAWCLGDWLAYGQRTYDHRYRHAVEQTRLDYQTLRNYAWVARRFELARRWDTLSFGHHAEVASLPGPEQDFWLRKAEQFRWSTSQLRREVRTSLHERQTSTTGPASPAQPGQPAGGQSRTPATVLQIPLTPQQSQGYELAASRQGLPLPAWITQILDHAAHTSP